MNKPLISFDYAIKYFLKDKGDYSVVESFISALLKTQGYKEVKIVALLDGESNKVNARGKKSIADVVVEDQDHHKYVVEIERSTKDSFIHKACFNTSRLISDTIGEGAVYTKVVKVFHISLLFFSMEENEGTIYHGKTGFYDTEAHKKLRVPFINENTRVQSEATDILPEYFVIFVQKFNDLIKKEIDDWLYLMKNMNKPDKFYRPDMEVVAEKLRFLKMSPEEQNEYIYFNKQRCDEEEAAKMQKIKGIEEGIVIGKAEGIKETVLNMLNLNIDITIIAQATGLSLEQVKILKASLNKSN